ncbi:hypothetical protein IAD21_05217 [Abditibacteriota bacterium]|nr:hypothetical protein IAD21_05217 [Abditibacteriota bacterium]
MSRLAFSLFLSVQVVLVVPAFAQFVPLPEKYESPQLSVRESNSDLVTSPSVPVEEMPRSPQLRATRPTVATRSTAIPRPPDGFYQTPDEVYPWMDTVARARPDRVRLLRLGQSSQGRAMWAMEIRPAGRTPAKLKRLAVICRQHGNEPEATASGTRFAAQFLAAATPQARVLAEKVILLVVPIANPDGAARYQRRTAQNIDMNRDWGHNHSPEVRALTQMVKSWKPQLVIDNHQWLPFEKMPPPMAEASGGQLARGVAQNMSMSNAARGFYLAARSRWGLDSLCHRFWGQRFGVPAVLLETRHRPSVQGARAQAIEQALSALWAATKTLGR